MNEFEQAKREYLDMEVPAELSSRVEAGVRQGKANYHRNRLRRTLRRSAGTVAACFVVMAGVLNLSPTVAAAAAEVPVLGGLFRVMTLISYNASDGGINYAVSVPRLETAGGSGLAQQVNAVIQEKVDIHLKKAQQDWKDYQDAFFATGGTQEEWGDRDMDVFVNYEIKSQTGDRVSFTVTLAEGWVTATEEIYCYNLDLAVDRDIILADLLGEDWKAVCDGAVRAYIQANTDADGFSYFFSPEEGGFTGVDEATAFYISEAGTPVLVFPEYTIAAGAAGIVEIPVQ
ncbi:RsiV family protein [uncultured Dysosmobacter sp.]|uniref:RsiV family protein n=1 Tax=uncultured Dysosmobacter sp. TaxID=2591384 RepID=UPI00263741F8|nr:RsiV family protein [uncultured Dysosmobacter sp.]